MLVLAVPRKGAFRSYKYTHKAKISGEDTSTRRNNPYTWKRCPARLACLYQKTKQLIMRSALSLLPRTSTVVQHLRFNSTRTFFIWMIHTPTLGHCFPFLFPEDQNLTRCFWSCLQNLIQDKSPWNRLFH